MKRFFTKKKKSEAEGWKTRKLEAEEAKKSSKFFMHIFEKPGISSLTRSMESPAPATNLLESKGGSSTNASPTDEKVKSYKSEYNEVKSKAVKESVDMSGGEDDGGGGGDIEFIDEILFDDSEPSELYGVEEPRTVIPEVIEQHDIGLLKLDTNAGKAILPDTLRIEIIKLGSKYFQNSEGPFLPTNNHSMNKTWFKRKLGNGHGEEVTHSWLVYSPSKKSAFYICFLLYSQSDHQPSLEQESGFNQWEAHERISVHENAKNHWECFTQWKEMERNLAVNKGLIDVELQSQIEKESRNGVMS
ncbi:uncharacterized protein LOC111083310 [Limulus polyphemus]|uniref:Uncharacterized protein LOC111083310 n=1 Tax=Limulus polyphemus TaxID=6850 RepID=A0ABM1RVQ2_LIMPO|nr:uncharacterized protein LOC111083310 [Limulus polyphemus]